MTTRRVVYVVVLALIVFPMAGMADSLIGTAGNGWVSGWTADNSGTPYWNNLSNDGTNKNVGSCLVSTGNCGIVTAPGALPTWANVGTGTEDPNVYFTHTAGTNGGTIQVSIAGNAAFNDFGYFLTNGTSIGPKTSLGTGLTSGNTVSFDPGGNYGFYLTGLDGKGGTVTYYTLASQAENDFQHFAFFDGGGGVFWIGVEDLNVLNKTDRDYNDLVIRISTVPEPGTLLMLGTGLLGAAGAIRRRLGL